MTKKKIIAPIIFVILFAIIWQIIYSFRIYPEKIFPSIFSIGNAFIKAFKKDDLGIALIYSLKLVGKGLLIGSFLSLVFSALSVFFEPFELMYSAAISFFDPLPGIALLPLAMMWIGIGEPTIILIIVHSVIWPFSRSLIDGFKSISKIYVEVGKNIGLSGFKLIYGVYLPASFYHILTGIKTGWARSWRALLSAEMVFGATSSASGIGWYIYTERYKMNTPGVLASLLVIIIVGFIIEYGVFEIIEKNTIEKWGMK